jgi:hypothetical protein
VKICSSEVAYDWQAWHDRFHEYVHNAITIIGGGTTCPRAPSAGEFNAPLIKKIITSFLKTTTSTMTTEALLPPQQEVPQEEDDEEEEPQRSSSLMTSMKLMVAAALLVSAVTTYNNNSNNKDSRISSSHRRLTEVGDAVPSYMNDLMEELKERKRLMEETPPEEVKYWFEYTGPLQVSVSFDTGALDDLTTTQAPRTRK